MPSVDTSQMQHQTDQETKPVTQPQRPAPYTKPDLEKIISLQDFKEVASKTLSPKAWAFYSSAATDLNTLSKNAKFYQKIMFRPRILRNVDQVNTRRSILGCSSAAPFFVSPAAMARLAHSDGERALAKGCANEGLIQVVSSPSTVTNH